MRTQFKGSNRTTELHGRSVDLGVAEPFDPTRYENARERVFAFMCLHMDQWLTREQLRTVGGDEAMRRVRELRDDFGFPIQMKHLGRSQYVYRMVEWH